MNHVYIGQGSGYGPFDNLGPMIEQPGPVSNAMDKCQRRKRTQSAHYLSRTSHLGQLAKWKGLGMISQGKERNQSM